MTQARTVWLTGGSGFIGKALRRRLDERTDLRVLSPSRAALDLTDGRAVQAFIDREAPSVVIHLAAATAGSAAMRAAPSDFLMRNLRAAEPLLRAVESGRVPRLIVAGSAGEYPRLTQLGEAPRGLLPEDLWRGPPAAGGYGLARRSISWMALSGAQAAGTEAAVLVLPTVWGPGDGGPGPLDPGHLRALPAFAARMIRARSVGQGRVEHFGSGFEKRDFLHVEDAAAAFEAAIDAPIAGQRLHISAAGPISTAELADRIATATGYTGSHRWRHRVPGQHDSKDQVWLAPAGIDALGWRPQRSLDSALADAVSDLASRLGPGCAEQGR